MIKKKYLSSLAAMFYIGFSGAGAGEEPSDRGVLFDAYLAAAQHALYGREYATDAQRTLDAATAALPAAAKNELLEELWELPAGFSVTCKSLPFGDRHGIWLSTFVAEHPHLAALSASEAEIFSALESITYAKVVLGSAMTQNNFIALRELVEKKWGLSAKKLNPEFVHLIQKATNWLSLKMHAKVCMMSYTKFDMSEGAVTQLDDPVLELVFQIAQFARDERAFDATAFAEAARSDGLDSKFVADLRRSGVQTYDFWRDWPLNSRTHPLDDIWLQPRKLGLHGCIKADAKSCQLTFTGIVFRPIDLSPLKSVIQGK